MEFTGDVVRVEERLQLVICWGTRVETERLSLEEQNLT